MPLADEERLRKFAGNMRVRQGIAERVLDGHVGDDEVAVIDDAKRDVDDDFRVIVGDRVQRTVLAEMRRLLIFGYEHDALKIRRQFLVALVDEVDADDARVARQVVCMGGKARNIAGLREGNVESRPHKSSFSAV